MPSTGATPSARREKAALIGRLLSHFWTADDPAETRRAQIGDWLEDLDEFPAEIVALACREWRRGDDRAAAQRNRRPTIADLRALCREEAARRRPVRTDEDEAWPAWLAALWGPEPDGPRRRAEALARERRRGARE